MAHTKMSKQINGFYKNTFDSSFNTVTMLRECTEKSITLALVRSPWFPEEGRKLVSDWLKVYRKGYDDFRLAADEQYKKMEMIFHKDNGKDIGAHSVETPEKADKVQGAHKTKKAK